MTTSAAPRTLAALRLLAHSGPRSFEQLIADLLSHLAGVPFRLARRGGPQEGADAFAPTAIAIEAKRYDSTPLKERDLRGELDQAADHHDLELYILSATTRVDGNMFRALKASASRKGLALLVLDATGFPPLPAEIPVLAAFCAIDADRVLAALSNPEWLDPRRTEQPDVSAVKHELAALRALPEFARFIDEMRTTVRELPTWRRLVERQNSLLLRKIQIDAETHFGTPFDPSHAITRSLQAEVAAWCQAAQTAAEPELAMLFGDRYDGKTWCLFGWLAADLATLRLPVFLVPSLAGDKGVPLYEHLLAQAREALGPSHQHHAEAVLNRHMDAVCGDSPWCVLLLDGLNEYRVHPDNPFQHLVWALARSAPDRRPCACLCTIRQPSWEAIAPRVERQANGRIRPLHIRPYDDHELPRALALEALTREWFDARPADVQEMLRRPRYLRLTAEHIDRLGSFTAVSEDVLHWLDAADKIRRARPGAPPDWNENAYQGVLKELATQYLATNVLRRDQVYTSLRRYTDEASAGFDQLLSEGVLRNDGDRYDVRPDALRVGMGLFVLYRLEATSAERPLEEELHDLLAPLQDTDQAAAYLGAAAIFALLAPVGRYATPIIDTLIAAWLGSRNLTPADIQQLRDLAPLLLEPLLRLAPETWSHARGNDRLQEASTLLFIDALSDRRDLVTYHLRRWLRTVPTSGSWVLADKEGSEARIAAQVADPHLARFGLMTRGDSGSLRLHNLALYLESRDPGLLRPEDCLALLAVQHVALVPAEHGQRLMLRRVLAAAPSTWFEEQAHSCLGSTDELSILHELLVAADRTELSALIVRTEEDLATQQHLTRRPPVDRDGYERLLATPDDQPIRVLMGARQLAVDPDLPKPSAERLGTLRAAWVAQFSTAALQLDRAPTGDDLQFEGILPAVAAWMPEAGAEVIRRQIWDLPRRLPLDQHWWALSLRRHAVLAEGETRAALLALSQTDFADTHRRLEVGLSLLALLPAMSPMDRVTAILDHHTINEWRTLFDFIEDLDDENMLPAIEARLDAEADPVRLLRARLLLSAVGKGPLSLERVQTLVRDLAHAGSQDRHGILAVAVRHRVTELPPELLLPITTDSTDKSTLPRWSASLLARQGAFLDRLPAYWRAVAAISNDALREQLLAEVERALLAHTVQDAPPDVPTLEIRLGSDGSPTSYRISLPSPAEGFRVIRPESTVGGLAATGTTAFGDQLRQLLDQDAFLRRQERLQAEAVESLRRRAYDLRDAWSSNEFPQALIDGLDPRRFTKWVTALLATGLAEVLWSWYGLLVSVFCRALREGHPLTSDLWNMVQPFPRSPAMQPARFMVGAVDWSLAELSNPRVDDETARSLLRDLIHTCRTDGELLDVALGARYRDPARVTRIALDLSAEPDPETRARGARLAGWLPGTETRLLELAGGDASLWVRRVADLALKDRARERFARHWFRRFLGSGSREERWGAAQLFLECVDAATSSWTLAALREHEVDVRTRGEALLLLAETENPAQQARQVLDKTFLEHQISSLEEICHPWHQQHGWDALT